MVAMATAGSCVCSIGLALDMNKTDSLVTL